MSEKASPSGSLSSHTTDPEEYQFSFQEVKQILDVVPHWIWIKNWDGEFIATNEKIATQLHGTDANTLRGLRDADMMDLGEEEFEKVMEDDRTVMETGETVEIPQERLTTAQGEDLVLRTIKQPFETEITEQEATIGVAMDIGHRLETDKLVGVHQATEALTDAESADEIADIAISTVTEVLDLDYCIVWHANEATDQLDLLSCSATVEDKADMTQLATMAVGPGDMRWDRFVERTSTVETSMKSGIDPGQLPVDESLASLIVLPIGDYGLLEVGSFEKDLFKDDLAKIVASSMETAFGRLERERELRRLSQEVEATTTEVAHSTDEVAEMSRDINEKADSQVQSMRSVSDEVRTMSATIEEIASTADQVESTSSTAAEIADDGQTSAEDAMAMMEQVTDAIERVADNVDSLEDHVEEIDQIVDIINDIAEQTDILALNATIEASRAAESGDAFAVVADEVKSLAGESKEHAGDIEDLIGNVQQNTDETVQSLEETIDLVDQGSERVDESMEKLVEITDVVEDVSSGIAEVADAIDDQAASNEEVASQVESAADVAEDMSSNIQQVAEANDEVSREVGELQSSVSRLAEDR
jgi:methyl-accepting chemotaxis protein